MDAQLVLGVVALVAVVAVEGFHVVEIDMKVSHMLGQVFLASKLRGAVLALVLPLLPLHARMLQPNDLPREGSEERKNGDRNKKPEKLDAARRK